MNPPATDRGTVCAICPLPGIPTMVDGPLGHLFWRVVDALDYWLMQVGEGQSDRIFQQTRLAVGRRTGDATSRVRVKEHGLVLCLPVGQAHPSASGFGSTLFFGLTRRSQDR
jgi:hypothetical protein